MGAKGALKQLQASGRKAGEKGGGGGGGAPEVQYGALESEHVVHIHLAEAAKVVLPHEQIRRRLRPTSALAREPRQLEKSLQPVRQIIQLPY